MKNFVTLPRTISVAGYTATINVKFVTYSDGQCWQQYYTSVSETAKAIKAIAKEAGFNIIRCKSESYSGGDSVDISVSTELTPEQTNRNNEIRSTCPYWSHTTYQDWTSEPREKLLHLIINSFKQGSFNGMEDIYEYSKDNMTVEWPNGDKVDLDTKYPFYYFLTPEEV